MTEDNKKINGLKFSSDWDDKVNFEKLKHLHKRELLRLTEAKDKRQLKRELEADRERARLWNCDCGGEPDAREVSNR